MSLETASDQDDGEELGPEAIEALRVYEEYRARVKAGEPPDPNRLLDEHPGLAEQLELLILAGQQMADLAASALPNLKDYRILGVLGRGGMATVYKAEQLSSHQHVAVKVLRSAFAIDPKQLTRFLKVEIPTAELLQHPHIVPIIASGRDDDMYYHVMPLIEGSDLGRLLKKLARGTGDPATAAGGPASGTAPEGDEGAEITVGRGTSSSLPSSGSMPQTWYRRVARWGRQAAEALDHAHQEGVVHRDIKPSNLLLDRSDNLWITDFGLAAIRGSAGLTMTGDLTGTPRYMSPEQIRAKGPEIDHRTDIYSLGATLYELLALRPAFEGDDAQDVMLRVLHREPAPLCRVNPNVPRDLETLVLKAMSKERGGRFRTAQELADELGRFQRGEPIRTRRPGLMDRASRLARRHRRAAATAVAALAVAVVILSFAFVMAAQAQKKAVFESLMQQILRLRLTPHRSGWSETAWALVREAALLHPGKGNSFQAQAAATLIGMDARLLCELPNTASSLAFAPDGRRLWMGGAGGGLRTWDLAESRLEYHGPAMDGPLAFQPDGTPLQLGEIPDRPINRPALQLRDPVRKRARTFELPEDLSKLRAYALSPEGVHVGAVAESSAGERTVLIWQATSRRLLHRIQYGALGMAFSPDSSLVAAWDGSGHIHLWTLPEAKPLATLGREGPPVHALAFGRYPGRPSAADPAARWILAAGHVGGEVIAWNLDRKLPINVFRGSEYDVFTVALGPDGTTLASAGRNGAKLWDVATGRLLLDTRLGNVLTGLAFSPDGRRLAVARRAAFGDPGGIHVYDLEDGRGIRTLRGLSAYVQKAIYAPDGRLVAALAHDWRVAIWDEASGQLRLLLDVPVGLTADNAGLVFSPDGGRFAFSAGRLAKLWDLKTGRELAAWPLPEGMQDTLVFRDLHQLHLLRVETADGADLSGPAGMTRPDQHPRVLRLRRLAEGRPSESIKVIADFNWGVHRTEANPDGTYAVVEGRSGPEGNTRGVNAYDLITGEWLWAMPTNRRPDISAWFLFDPTGAVLCRDDILDATLLAMPSRAPLGQLRSRPFGLGPRAAQWLGIAPSEPDSPLPAYSIFDRHGTSPFLQIAFEPEWASSCEFRPDGRQIAWVNAHGSVSLCDLDRVRDRLSRVGLGW